MAVNQQVLIDRLPEGALRASDFKVTETEIPDLQPDQVLIETLGITISAGLRAGLQGSASYAGAPKTGIPMSGMGVGRILKSNTVRAPEGAMCLAMTGCQSHAVVPENTVEIIPDSFDPIECLAALGINVSWSQKTEQ